MCSAHVRLLRCHLPVHFESNRLRLMFRKRRKKRFWLLVADALQVVLPQLCIWCDCFWETFALQVLLETAAVYLWQHDFSQDFYIHCIAPSSHFVEFPQWYCWMQCYSMFLIEYTSCILLHWCHYPGSHDITVSCSYSLERRPKTAERHRPGMWGACEVPPQESILLWGISTGEHPLRRPLKIKVGV